MFYTKLNGTLLGPTLYPLYIMSNIIFKRKLICFYPHYSHTRFVYTKLRLHPRQIIRVITTLLFAKFSHICQCETDLKLYCHNWAYGSRLYVLLYPLSGFSRILKLGRLQRGKAEHSAAPSVNRLGQNKTYFPLDHQCCRRRRWLITVEPVEIKITVPLILLGLYTILP